LTFAKEALNFKADDYVNITSFTHQPYYQPFIIEVPDNFSNGSYYNLPLDEMINLVKNALNSGYSLMWDADVSNNGFKAKKGLALNFDQSIKVMEDSVAADAMEEKWDASKRQKLFETLVTEDDHLMHITGIEKTKKGKIFFIVKNSWGAIGPYNGYVNVSEAYFAMNTISLVIPKAAFSKVLLDKLKIQ
jgi:bleomycin hydrolase